MSSSAGDAAGDGIWLEETGTRSIWYAVAVVVACAAACGGSSEPTKSPELAGRGQPETTLRGEISRVEAADAETATIACGHAESAAGSSDAGHLRDRV